VTISESKVAASYGKVARAYADKFYRELEHKALDRALLGCVAEQLRGKGIVADVGCGPGHVAHALSELGVTAIGIDLVPEMIDVARTLAPNVEFACGSMLGLDVPDGAWAGIVALYAIVNLDRDELPIALREFRRVLAPGGCALISFHVGDERVHLEEFLGERVDLDFTQFPRAHVEAELVAAGFSLEWSLERAPYPEEYSTRRAYLLGRC
jgi:SAM-dependent methyltransferase